MFLRMNKALNDRRAGLKREEGFTLIELLVVVIIIGILAAIAIPIFIGVQNNAKNAAVQSDLTNAKTAVVAYFTENPAKAAAGPALTVAALGKYGFTNSANTTFAAYGTEPLAAGDPFCIQAARADDATVIFHVTDSDGVTKDAC